MTRKVMGDMSLRRNQLENSFRPGQDQTVPKIDATSVVSDIGDALRYTMILPVEAYTASVEKCLEEVKTIGVSLVKCKNFWAKGDTYQVCDSPLPHTLPCCCCSRPPQYSLYAS